MNEVASFFQKTLVAIGEIARHLAHPLAIRSRKDSGDLDSPALEVDDEKDEIPNQSRLSDHFDTEEVGCRNRTPVSLQEHFPRHPVWCQNSADRLSGPSFVVVEETAQPFVALNSGSHVDHATSLLDQPVVESLMTSLDVVVLRVLLHGVA